MLWVVMQGFAMGASLIMAIGAQNAFVLQNGLQGRHRFVVALCCAGSDMVLIGLGVAGMGSLIASSPVLLEVVRWGGALFLLWYGWGAVQRAWKGGSMGLAGQQARDWKATLLTTLAFTWLNPHVYLDTVVLLGSLSASVPGDQRYLFGLGSSLSSFVWFFSLSYGSRLLAPLFVRPIAWRILDSGVALMMFTLAVGLLTQGPLTGAAPI